MYYRGSLEVLSALIAGKPVVVCAEGGGNRCVASIGVLEGLARTRREPKAYVGVSGSAFNVAGSATKQIEGVFEVYAALTRDKCLSLEWIFSWPYGWSLRFQFDREKLLRRVEELLDIPALRESTSAVRAAVLHYDTGDGSWLDLKENTIENLRATVSIPNVCEPVEHERGRFVDGMRIPITPAIRTFWARHVLIIRNRAQWWFEEQLYPYLAHASLWSLPSGLRAAVANADWMFQTELERVRACARIKYLEIGPDFTDPFLYPWSDDVELMNVMRMNAREFTIRLIGEADRTQY